MPGDVLRWERVGEHRGKAVRDRSEAARLASRARVRDRRLDQVARAVELVGHRGIGEAAAFLDDLDVGVHVAVGLLRRRDQLDARGEKALLLGIAAVGPLPADRLEHLVEVRVAELRQLVGGLRVAGRDAEVLDRAALLEHLHPVGDRHLAGCGAAARPRIRRGSRRSRRGSAGAASLCRSTGMTGPAVTSPPRRGPSPALRRPRARAARARSTRGSRARLRPGAGEAGPSPLAAARSASPPRPGRPRTRATRHRSAPG